MIESTTYDLGGVFVTNKKIMIVLVSISLMVALHQFVKRSKWGMAMRAMAFDYAVVPLMGVSINKVAQLTFAIGSALAAVAGHSIRHCLPGSGSLHGDCFWLEGVSWPQFWEDEAPSWGLRWPGFYWGLSRFLRP